MKQYLDIVNKVLTEGRWKKNRTGIDTLAIPGARFEHDMSQGFPLLTTKKIPFRLVASELEFFIKGLTDKKWLQDRDNHIWDEWAKPADPWETERDPMKRRDLGPIYGWQWRNFGALYGSINEPVLLDATGLPVRTGIDQLKNLVNKLKTDPNDRRMIVTAWNPLDIGMMALPACHYGFQVTHIDGVLSLEWSQRSVDVALGLPFNIASYGLLLELLCLETGLKPGMLIGFLADTHVYANHVDGLKEQLTREPMELPVLQLSHQIVGWDDTDPTQQIPKWDFSIFDWEYTDARVEGYKPRPTIKFEVAV